jgi:exosome complex RNA-binding protein Csl4
MKIIIALIVLAVAAVAILTVRRRQTPQKLDPKTISYSQVDITEQFGDNERLKPEDWIETVAINKSARDPEKVGLPSLTASADDVYRIAAKLSKLREQIPIPNDGVYCPVCHIANIDIKKLNTACPKCGRNLLKFGWD